MEKRGVKFFTIKGENMIKIKLNTIKPYLNLESKLRKKIKTPFSVLNNLGFIKAGSRKGLVVKIILSL